MTSVDLVFAALQDRRTLVDRPADVLDIILPTHRAAPIVPVVYGHPLTLSFLGALNSTPIACPGVTDFGYVGEVEDLHRTFDIDAPTIAGPALDLMDECECQRQESSPT